MKAAIIESINSPLVVGEVGLTELDMGQVRVKVLMSGLCGAQLQEIAGLKGNASFMPHLLGHEGSGIVEEVGEGVTKVKVGDKVIMHWRKGDGIESVLPAYRYKSKVIASGKVITLAEQSIVSENRLTPVPQDTPNELCALLGCGLSTALGIINNDANLKFGETVLILGAGGVGLNLIKAAKLASAGEIMVGDIRNDKKELVEKEGAIFFSTANLFTDALNRKKFDVIIDTTSNMHVVSNFLPYLNGNGRCIIVSLPIKGTKIEFFNPANFFSGEGQIITSTQGGKVNPSVDFARYVKLHQAGKLTIDNIITHHFKLDDINEAIRLVKEGKAGRIMIDMV